MEKIPLTAYELIEDLDRLYPEVVYDASEKHDEFLLRSGERRLVLALRRRMEVEIDEGTG
jgi:hypothetical protein